jgi:hypothetical protein
LRRIRVQLERKKALRMRMLKMRLICHPPELILKAEERALLVAVGQQESLQKLRRKMMMVMMRRRRKRCLMWKKSTLPTMLKWDLLCSGRLQTLHGGQKLATRARLNL